MLKIIVEHRHYIHHEPDSDSQTQRLLRKILNITENIMSKTQDLEAKIDGLQTALDAEQEQIRTAIEELGSLRTEVVSLREQLAQQGADNEALDRIISKVDAITEDLQGTIEDTPTDPIPEA